ncbi:MAG: tyrosine-type recombinase/integrase [Ktedonobacteraceae bacterium]|nr:tyrosine-type recombinase/integrase [Ktedonobacteraceae bacterium]
MNKKGKRGNREGSIYQRKSDGLWVGSITLENGKRKVFYGKKQQEVIEKVKIALYEQQQGVFPTASSKQTVAQFLHGWLENTQMQSVRPRTYERYEETVRLHIVPVLGRIHLQKLTAQQVQALYARKLKEGLSPTTVNTFHNVLHKALETAKKWRLLTENVCDFVDPPRVEQYEVQPLTLEQIRRLLAAARGKPIEPIVTLALATGMRLGELMGLKWQDIDMKEGTLHIQRILSRVPTKLQHDGRKGYVEAAPKTKKSRRPLIIASFALKVLEQHRERQQEAKKKADDRWIENDFIFCTSIGTCLNPYYNIRKPLKLLLKEAELPTIRFHDLRHSAATLLLGMGIHPKIVQEILGHSNISITMNIYSHVLPSMQREAMDTLNSAFTDQREGGSTEEETLPKKDDKQD